MNDDHLKGPNVWGTEAKRMIFQTDTLVRFQESLKGLTFDQLKVKHDDLLAQINILTPGTRGWTETTIFEYAVREQLAAKSPG